MKIHKNSVVAIITFSIILLIILAIILPKFPIFVVKRTFNYATQNIVNISGLSHWLVKGILVFVLIPFYWGLLEVSRINVRLFSAKRSHRKLGKIVIVTYAGLFFLAMFFLSRGTYFGHFKGEAIKYYANTPEGIRFFDSPGFDPKYGIELKPVTPDMMGKYQKRLQGMIPKRIPVESMDGFEFFDPITGEPKVWYYSDDTGIIEFFNGPGYHPTFNVELKPVTLEVIQGYKQTLGRKKADEMATVNEKNRKEKEQQYLSYLNRYVNSSFAKGQADKNVALLVIEGATTKEKNELGSLISESVRSQMMNPVLNLFKQPFIKDGLFEKVFSGNASAVNDLRVGRCASYLLLGKAAVEYIQNTDLQDTISAAMNLEIKLISAENGAVIDSAVLTATGVGFSNAAAEKQAGVLMSNKIGAFLQRNFPAK
jgi:hypothetical protein